MFRLFAVLLTGVALATIWRRRELRSDADRASKAVVNAAATARLRLATSEPDGGSATVEGAVAAADPATSTRAERGPAQSPA